MARYMRRYGRSFSIKPVVVFAPFVAPPLDVTLTNDRLTRQFPRRRTLSQRITPAVVGGGIFFEPVSETLVAVRTGVEQRRVEMAGRGACKRVIVAPR